VRPTQKRHLGILPEGRRGFAHSPGLRPSKEVFVPQDPTIAPRHRFRHRTRAAILLRCRAIMQIAPHTVVSIEYTLKDADGKVLDSSEGREPLDYLHGAGNIIPGLEKALLGKEVGESVDVVISPEEGYGRRDEKLVRNIPLRKLADKNPQVGRRYRAQIDDGIAFVLVTAVKGDYATIDANHPLADKTLHFAVKVAGVREATQEEREHGHVHGAHGHGH
jgi:FKBP-type peptidyl-prolyl cis-trans isomerase SlyD